MAEKIKNFLSKKKSDLKFKKAGPGHKLSESSSTSGVVQRPVVHRVERGEQTEAEKAAAAAALARFGGQGANSGGLKTSQMSIQAQARKQIERERQEELARQISASPVIERREPVVTTLEAAPVLAVNGVYFKCPLIGDEVLSKEEWVEKIREFLYASLEDEQEAGLTACLIIRTLNLESDKVDLCIETMLKYLKNILQNPGEEKYRKIRLSNRIFQERVACMEGALEFLRACGFQELELDGEAYLVFSAENREGAMDLEVLMDALHSCEPLALSVDRNARVLASTSQAATCSISLPPEFFHRAPDELKREQRERSEKMELEMTLRTKAMRERDEERGREVRNYKFCIVRVKFPDNLILQGTFGVTEPFSAVLEFVREAVRPCLAQFSLSLSGLKLSGQDSDRTLLELNLVPASILNFHCDSSSIGGGREEVQAGDSYYLKPEVSVLLSD